MCALRKVTSLQEPLYDQSLMLDGTCSLYAQHTLLYHHASEDDLGQDILELKMMHDLHMEQPMCPIDCELLEGIPAPEIRSRWLAVAHKPVTPGASRTVLETAWLIIDELKRSTTTFEATSRWLRLLAHAGVMNGENGPDESNRWPPSLYICRRLLSVPDLSAYEIHVCPKGCRHYFSPLVSPEDHLRNCKGCDLCLCPVCLAPRFNKQDWGLEPASKCYFLHDVVEQWMMDSEWLSYFLKSKETVGKEGASPWHQSKEFQRIETCLKALENAQTNPVRILPPSVVPPDVLYSHMRMRT
jgi:hypothetical protein